jgi:hypothetical protein
MVVVVVAVTTFTFTSSLCVASFLKGLGLDGGVVEASGQCVLG